MAPLEPESLRKMSEMSEGYGSEERCGEGSQQGEEEEEEESVSEEEQVFVNRSLNMDKITCYGFDMDYTLCEYISPQFDELAFTLARNWMVEHLHYSDSILHLKYDPQFAVRGLWYDRLTGNLLKTDQFGKILVCYHGFRILRDSEIKAVYPGKVQRKDEKRVFVMNTLFNLAETFLVAALIDLFDGQEDVVNTEHGWTTQSGTQVTFQTLFQDIRTAVDDIHLTSKTLKISVITDPGKYVRKDPRLYQMLTRIREDGRKTFLLTNSDWWYTKPVMTYLLGPSWTQYFNIVGVDACKPRFFSSGTPLCLVSTQEEGTPKVSLDSEPSGPRVYSGGNQETYTQMLGVKPWEVVYVGDHLWADVIRCRKQCEWRTVLIVPELEHELEVRRRQPVLLDQLETVESLLVQSGMETETKSRLWSIVNRLNREFTHTGSLFRSGTRLSYFGSQVTIWPDLYTGRVSNLGEYSLNHRFLQPFVRLPHEVAVNGTESDVSSEMEGLMLDEEAENGSSGLVVTV